jgi:hypothetical protein
MLVPVLLSAHLLTSEVTIPTISPPTTITNIVPTGSSSTENYLPRKLYPGTYKNYCGPTPEVTVKDGCKAHGWHGDEAWDEVDAACQLHDISYCSCETELMQRKQQSEQFQGLSSLIALRFLTLPALNQIGVVDQDYVKCIHKADSDLIATGIKIRRANQQSNCQRNPSLGWFCQEEGGTLAAFEKINLSIFLKDLDADESRFSITTSSPKRITLSELESKRQNDLMKERKSGKSLAEAISSKAVQDDEEEMLEYLEISVR